MLDGEPVVEDCACEDLTAIIRTHKTGFIDYLLEHEVSEERRQCVRVWSQK